MGVRGSAGIRRCVRDIRIARDVVLPESLVQGLSEAAEPLEREAKSELLSTMPSGYGPIVSAALMARVDVSRSGSGATISISARAPGRREDRDLPALNQGRLRHPVFGNRRKWVVQGVPAGFWTRPANKTIRRIERQVARAVGRTAAAIRGGR